MKTLLKFLLVIPTAILAVLLALYVLGKAGGSGEATDRPSKVVVVTSGVAPSLDYGAPVFSVGGAIVCDQSVLIRAATSPQEKFSIGAVYDMYTSVLNRSRMAEALGCQEWRDGIQIYNAHRMKSPFDAFVGFSTSPKGMIDLFTMEPNLRNSLVAQADSVSKAEGKSPIDTLRSGHDISQTDAMANPSESQGGHLEQPDLGQMGPMAIDQGDPKARPPTLRASGGVSETKLERLEGQH